MENNFSVKVIEENALSSEYRESAFLSFPKNWQEIPGNTPERAWTQQEPTYRVAAHDDNGFFVGQIGLVSICSDPAIYGVSDASVKTEWRRRGVAAALIEFACEFADKTGHRVMIATSNPGLRRVCGRLGFYPVTDQVKLDGYEVTPESWMGRGDIQGAVINDLF